MFKRGDLLSHPLYVSIEARVPHHGFPCPFAYFVQAAHSKVACPLLSSALPTKSSKSIRKDFTTAIFGLPLSPPVAFKYDGLDAYKSRINKSSFSLNPFCYFVDL